MEWVEEGSNEHAISSRKRKTRPKRLEFIGWGSKQLIKFLESRGKDITKIISRFEASEAIGRYITEKGLLDPTNKKKVICDEKLSSIFGSKPILRVKVYDLLEKHYKENDDDSDFEYLYEDDEKIVFHEEKAAKRTRKVVQNQKARSIFAAVVSDNVKLVYLRKSLVQELVKSTESFESKMLGSFVRIKSDPNDYMQKNPYQLVQVIGVKKGQGGDEFLLQVTNYVKDVSISALSDDNFSKEECEDLRERVNNDSLKKPTIVEMEEKARSLHEDQTKHWLGREIVLLQRLIDRANEKGMRRELSEYLEKRELLQKPEEESRLLQEVLKVIEEKLEETPEEEASPEPDENDNEQRLSESPMSCIQETPETRNLSIGEEGFLISNLDTTQRITPYAMDVVDKSLPTWTAYTGDVVEQPENGIIAGETPTKETITVSQIESTTSVVVISQSQTQPNQSEVINLSDDEEDDNGDGETLDPKVEDVLLSYDKEKLNWLYKDPQGVIQGPFSLAQLKQWSDAEYFAESFKVWMIGQSIESAVLLTDVLRQSLIKN